MNIQNLSSYGELMLYTLPSRAYNKSVAKVIIDHVCPALPFSSISIEGMLATHHYEDFIFRNIALISFLVCSITDPFADTGEEEHRADQKAAANEADKKPKQQSAQNYIHIRIQQRNGRKTLTTLQGLPKGKFTPLDLLYRLLRKNLAS